MAYIPSGCTVKEYEEVVYSGKCDNKLYLSFGGVELENADEYCEKITGTNKILSNGNNYFSLDNFVSRELNITLHDVEIKKIIDSVDVKIGTNVNGTYIYVPVGIFNIQDSPKSAKGTIKIQLRDNSVKFDFNYNAKPLIDLNGGSATKRQILEDICTKAGVKHKIPYFLGEDDEIGIYDSTVKARIYVSYIAEQASVFPTIDRDGDLIFVDIKDQKKVVTGETINLLNATNRDLAKLTFDGRSSQETTSGEQLYDVKDVFVFSSGVSRDSADWLTISCDNTDGTSTKYFDFKTKISENVQPSTTYDLFIEIKSVSGNGNVYFVTNQPIGQSATFSGNSLANLSVGTIKPTFTTKDDFTECTNFLNSYATFPAGQSGSITFRISVLETNLKTLDNFVYEPFTGVRPSPNTDYPSEIKSIEGKNKCDVSTSQIGVAWNLTTNSARAICNVKVYPNTSYSLSFDSISGIDGLYFCEKVNSTDTTIIGNLIQITAHRQITTTSTTNYLVIQFNKANITMSDIEALKLQVERGTTVTAYMPYSTIRYKQVGTQLFHNTVTYDIVNHGITTTFSDNTYNLSGTTDTNWANLTPTFVIALPIGTYTISIDEPQTFRLVCRFTTIDYERYDRVIEVGSTSTTFTTTKPMMRAYLYISVATGTTINTSFKFQLQAGDKALPIEEYKEAILNINLQGNKLCSLSNDVKDELIVENGKAKIVKNVQEFIINDSSTIIRQATNESGKYRFNIPCDGIPNTNSWTIPNLLCSHFKIVSRDNTWLCTDGITTGLNTFQIYDDKFKAMSVDELKTWLSNNNIIVQHKLETPVEIDLGEVTQPKTFEGVNNISNSEDTNMSIEYLSPKEPKKLPIDYIEDYENGEPYEISKTIYESGIIKFEDGTETNDILYLNSANPYISNLEQVKKINENLKGLKLNSFSVSKIKGNLLIDPYDLIEVESENSKFVTLGQNTFTYDGSIMQSFSTEIGKEIRKTNVSASSEATYRKLAQTDIDNVKGEIRLYVEEQVSQVEDQINGESGINENLELIKNSIETIKSTMLKQTAEQFEMLFKQTGIEEIVNSVDNLTKDNNTKLNELEQWIRFKGASIELGRSDSQVKLMLQNDEIYFMTGGVKTGRIKDNMIFIENSIVTNSFKQGLSSSGQDKALWEERVETSGNKNLRWIGGAY